MEAKGAANRSFIVLFGVYLIFLPCIGHTAIPQKINYQGYLTNTAGVPVNETVQMRFSIYDVSSGGSALWTETQNIPVINGIYNVALGDVTPIPLPFDVQYYLAIKVGSDPEMTPRKAMTSVGYAFRAMTADVVGVHDHSGADITSGTVAEPRIDSLIARDSEVTAAIGTHASNASAHHTRYTNAEAVAAILAADGVGSGLDADLLDGQHGSAFATSSHNHDSTYVNVTGDTMTGTLNLPVNGLVAGTNQLVLSGGKVGIGTTTLGAKLEVSDLTRIQGSTWPSFGKGMELAYNSSLHKGYVQVYDRDMNIWGDLYLGDGNVGIGVNPPLVKLDVNGQVRARNGYGDSIRLGGDSLANDLEISISAPPARNWISLWNEQGGTPVGLGTGNIRITGAGNGIEFPDGTKVTSYRGFPRPNFDSGWNPINAGTVFTLGHNLGGDINNYFVDLQFKSDSTIGIHNIAIGGDYGGDWVSGAHYKELTTTSITVYRYTDDIPVNQFRVRIWVYE